MKNIENPLISIILPVYNIETYLDDCINSLMGQSYKNIEIILVDDGSTDKSGEKCDSYANKNKNIIVVHQENKGVGSARNRGINISKGEYIVFVDPDDITSKYYLEIMLENLKKYDCDMIVSNYTNNMSLLYGNNKEDSYNNIEVIDAEFVFNKMLDNKSFDGFLWNKIFKAYNIKKYNIRFSENIKIWEDMLFVLNYIKTINKIGFIDIKLYFYRIRKNSATTNKNIGDKITSKLNAISLFLELAPNESSEFYKNAEKIYLENLIEYIYFYRKSKLLIKEQKQKYYNEIRRIRKKHKINFKYKVKYFLSIFYI